MGWRSTLKLISAFKFVYLLVVGLETFGFRSLYRVVDRFGNVAEGDEAFGFYLSPGEAKAACASFDQCWPDYGPHSYEKNVMKTFYHLAYEDEYGTIRTQGLTPLEDGYIHLYDSQEDAITANDWIDTRIDPVAYEEAQRALHSGDKNRYWLGIGKAVQQFTHATLVTVTLDETHVPVCTPTDETQPACRDRSHHYVYRGNLHPESLQIKRIPLPDKFDEDPDGDDE